MIIYRTRRLAINQENCLTCRLNVLSYLATTQRVRTQCQHPFQRSIAIYERACISSLKQLYTDLMDLQQITKLPALRARCAFISGYHSTRWSLMLTPISAIHCTISASLYLQFEAIIY